MSARRWLWLWVFLAAPAAAEDWPQYARNETRSAVAASAVTTDLTTPRLVIGSGLNFIGPSSPVVMKGAVFACTRRLANTTYVCVLMAFDEATGQFLWEYQGDTVGADSWASPGCDPATDTVFFTANKTLYCLAAETGAFRWQRNTDLKIVNASPCAAGGRVFITDYFYGTATGSKLYSFDIATGDLAWSKPIGAACGATPAYSAARVYVATRDGVVFGFNASDGSEAWHKDFRTLGEGWEQVSFFGGVCCAHSCVYAASYDFAEAAKLVKLNAENGSVVWHTPCERTDSIPIAVGTKVFLAGGLTGFGSQPKLQAFNDFTAAKLWETTLVGGWTLQPAYVNGYLYAGLIPPGATFQPYSQLHVLDVTKKPTEDGFVVSSYELAGGSPALASSNVYSIGAGGIYAFGPRPQGKVVPGDVSGDRCVNVCDLLIVRNCLGKQGSAIPPGVDCAPPGQPDGIVNVSDLLYVRNNLGKGYGCK